MPSPHVVTRVVRPAIALVVGALAATAQGAWNEGLLTVSGGAAAVFDDGDTNAEFGLRYRFPLFDESSYTDPFVGLTATEEGDLFYYLGVQVIAPLGPRFQLLSGIGGGIYDVGDGRDLGGPFQFWLSFEVAGRLNRYSSLGVALTHLSNFQIYDANPATESLLLTYNFDLGAFRRRREPVVGW